MTAPPPGGNEDDDQPAFFTTLMDAEHDPYELEATVNGELVEVVLEVPDGVQVAALDRCRSAMDDLWVLADGPDDPDGHADLLDVLDALGVSPVDAADDLLAYWALDRDPTDGWADLVWRLDRWGEAIEFDLWERGYDLAVYVRGGRDWDHLLRIVSRLPQGSHTWAAKLDDDELADLIAEHHGPPHKRPKRQRPALVGWTPEVAALHAVTGRVERLEWATFRAQGGKKGSPPKPPKGPETADDRWEQRDFLREHEEITAQVLKRKGGSKRRAAERQPPPEAVRGAVDLSTLADAHHRP